MPWDVTSVDFCPLVTSVSSVSGSEAKRGDLEADLEE